MRLPPGTRDWLPAELRRKRAVETALRAAFERWAYDEVLTPSFERVDALEAGLGDDVAQLTFTFRDATDSPVALRPEMTTPVARLVSTRMREAPLPLRLSYLAPVYRSEAPQEGRMREFTTAGVELIGPSSLDADAESLFTAIDALDALGLTDARFDVNHAAIVEGILVGFGLEPDARVHVKNLLSGRNVVALRAYLRERMTSGGGIEDIVALALDRGGDAFLERVAPHAVTAEARDGVERLRGLLARAGELGHAHRVAIDFSLLRDISYYTGFIFEGFASDVGFALCGGGRYDRLLPRFGFDAGAVGWSLAVERILIALERRRSATFGAAPGIDVIVSGSDVIAARERAAGKVVRMDFDGRSEIELIEDARRLNIPRIVMVRDGTVRDVAVGSRA